MSNISEINQLPAENSHCNHSQNNEIDINIVDAIEYSCHQLTFLRSLITQASDGIELTQESLMGFGLILDNITDKLSQAI